MPKTRQGVISKVASSPLSGGSAPSHAFPTAYPPPHRPPSRFPPVEWLRLPAAPAPSSASTIDINSLCLRFEKSLIIDQNPSQTSQLKATVFSFPVVSEEGDMASHPRAKLRKRGLSRAQNSRDPTTSTHTSVTQPRKAATSRQPSAPPSFSPYPSKTKLTSRRASAPVRIPVSSMLPDPTCHVTQATSLPPQNHTIGGGLGGLPHLNTNAPPHPQPLLNPMSDQTTCTTQEPPGQTKFPAFSSDLSPVEPIIIPSTPVQLSPGPSISIADPFHQFQSPYDYFFNTLWPSSSDYIGPTVVLPSKGAFDTPLGLENPFYDIAAYIAPKYCESNLPKSSAVF